jgi:hypothetical protein
VNTWIWILLGVLAVGLAALVLMIAVARRHGALVGRELADYIVSQRPELRVVAITADTLLLEGDASGQMALGLVPIIQASWKVAGTPAARAAIYAAKLAELDWVLSGRRADAGQPADADLPHDVVLARAVEELRIRTELQEVLFQVTQATEWHMSQNTGRISFTSPEGVTASADAQIIGSYDTVDGSWLWAWDNPCVEPRLTEHARLTRRYGTDRTVPELTSRKLQVSTQRAWELTALACKLGGGQGAFVGPAGTTLIYFTFGEMKMERA